MPSMFDDLPWEILHIIFDFLKTIDLLHAFIEINSHVDSILHSYPRIQLNFQSMKKSTFYFICKNIYPEQIQTLVLFDDEHTPGQIKLFMSLLPLIQCNNLQHMSIHGIQDPALLCLMLSHLENKVHIRSLSVDGYSISISKKNSRSISTILTTLPSLKYLTFKDSSALISLRQPLPNLTHLTIPSCRLEDLRIIFPWVPNLLNLQISISYNDRILIFDYVPPHLTSLKIESKSWILFNELEKFFSLTPLLKHLILELTGEQALLNGGRWEALIKTKLPYLTEFALNISPEENTLTGDDVLIPFQSLFWTTVKHWSMACLISTMSQSCARLFSIPHFTPTDEWYPQGEGFVNYSLVPYSFDDNYTELKVSHYPEILPVSLLFKHIQTLSLESSTINVDHLQKCVDLLSVNHLKLGRYISYTSFNDLLQVASNIFQVTIDYRSLLNIITSFTDDQTGYEQIRILTVTGIMPATRIDKIYRLFPKLEHISLHGREREDILQVFNGLHSLISAATRWLRPCKIPLSTMDEYLQQNDICTDGTYWFHASSLHVWID